MSAPARVAASPGRVIWITGLSGAGKSTLAAEVASRLREGGEVVSLVDGDVVRELLGGDLGHSREDRLANAWRISRLSRFLAEQGVTVVCATMSLFSEIHAWNRANLPGYLEVYVRVPIETLVARDARGLYGRALRGEVKNVAGIDLAYDEPKEPDLVLHNDFTSSALTTIAEKVLEVALAPRSAPTVGRR